MKKRFFAIFVTVALVFSMMPGTAFSVFAEDAKHPCNDTNCTVCKVAELINALPEAEDITVDNAAAVLAQIHAIDRLKGDLNFEDEDEYGKYEYDYMLDMVEAMPDPSGYGVNIPKRYQEAVAAIQNLGAGGSLMIIKKFALDDATLNSLDWPQVDATFTIKCMSHDSSFNGGQPLNVTLSDINNLGLSALYNNGFHYPTPDADGWVNTYILPAGTYKITETDYTAITKDGENIATIPIYSGTNADGKEAEVTDDGIIVEVEAGKMTLADATNAVDKVDKVDVEFTVIDGDSTNNATTTLPFEVRLSVTSKATNFNPVEWFSKDENPKMLEDMPADGNYIVEVTLTPGHYLKTAENGDITFDLKLIEGVCIISTTSPSLFVGNQDSNTKTITLPIYTTLPDQDGDDIREPDTNDDGIYEGTKGRRYIPDQDGDGKPEPESNTEPGIYDGTKDKKKYVPSGEGNVEEVTEPDEEGIYEGTTDSDKDGKPDNRYTKDTDNDGIPEKYYDIIDGELLWIIGNTEDLTFTIDGPADKFKQLIIGGDIVDKESYKYVSGSTIITLDADYLNELEIGSYDVEAVYTDGKATTTLTVKDEDTDDGPDSGDDANMLPWIILAITAALTGAVVALQRKKKA